MVLKNFQNIYKMILNPIKKKLLTKLTNNGNKFNSEKIFKKSIKLLQKNLKKNYKEIFKKSVINASPVVIVKQIKRRRKQIKEFPYIIHKTLRISLGLKSMVNTVKNKKKKNFFYKELTDEFLLTTANKSSSVKIRKDIYENSFKTKKYANFRWF